MWKMLANVYDLILFPIEWLISELRIKCVSDGSTDLQTDLRTCRLTYGPAGGPTDLQTDLRACACRRTCRRAYGPADGPTGLQADLRTWRLTYGPID